MLRLAAVASDSWSATRQDLAEEGGAVDRALIAAASQPAQARKFDAEAALRQQAAAITARLKEVDAALDRSFPQYASLASAAPLPLTEVGSLVGPSEALLLFVPTRDGTFLWAITGRRAAGSRFPWAVAACHARGKAAVRP